MSEVIGVILDLGLGALAFKLTTQLQAIVNGLTVMVKDHEDRIKKLEEKA